MYVTTVDFGDGIFFEVTIYNDIIRLNILNNTFIARKKEVSYEGLIITKIKQATVTMVINFAHFLPYFVVAWINFLLVAFLLTFYLLTPWYSLTYLILIIFSTANVTMYILTPAFFVIALVLHIYILWQLMNFKFLIIIAIIGIVMNSFFSFKKEEVEDEVEEQVQQEEENNDGNSKQQP